MQERSDAEERADTEFLAFFGDLDIDSLACIDLFTGFDGSGKTTLPEALVLLSGGGDRRVALDTGAPSPSPFAHRGW